MAKKKESSRRDPKEVRRELQLVERELTDLGRLRWKYSKRLLSFGVAAWLFGVSTFVSAVILYQGPMLIANAPMLSWILLGIAAAAPIALTFVIVRKFVSKMKRLEQLRRGLLSEYESTLLKEVGKMVSE